MKEYKFGFNKQKKAQEAKIVNGFTPNKSKDDKVLKLFRGGIDA